LIYGELWGNFMHYNKLSKMALTVPPQQIPHIKALLGLSDDKITTFLNVLSKAGPQFNVYDLATELSSALESSDLPIVPILRVLASLYLTRPVTQPIDKFVDEAVFPALKSARAFSQENADAQWQKLRNFLIGALSFERTLGTAAKAGDVLTQHERIFQAVRVITDLRPIFHVDVTEHPDAAVIIHTLKITQRDHFGHRSDLYFALDHNDVVAMKDVIDRALKKEQTLKEMIKESAVTVLDPRLVY
jgi:hypothetical protein